MTARHIVHVLTVSDSLIFIDTLVQRSLAEGFEVTIVTSPDERLQAFGRRHNVRTVPLDMPRRVTPLGDWAALTQLHRLLERLRPGIVHAHTPKGGLLGSLAAKAANVPIRIYHMRGLPFVTLKGPMKTLLATTERISCSAATRVICQSNSLRKTALANALVRSEKCEVVLQGSNGVDCDGRFVLTRHAEKAAELRTSLAIPTDAVVVGFVGRLVRDKGIPELVEAFELISKTHDDVWLLLTGHEEARDAIDENTRRVLSSHPRIRSLGFLKDPAVAYAAADLVALPSHREGFPNVPLEAASMSRPVISTLVDGCTDAVEQNVTGLLVDVNAPNQLAAAIEQYVRDPALRARHGANGRSRVERFFRRDEIAKATIALYDREILRVSAI